MITVAVCDDNLQFAKTLTKAIRKLCSTVIPEQIVCHIAIEFNSCDDVLKYLENNTINILFLDINMPTRTGFDLAEQLNQKYPDIIIIFVSAYDNFVYTSFEYSPFRFLRKSHLEKELTSAFTKAVETCMSKDETLIFSTIDGDISLRTKEIYYFEAQKNYYMIHCAGIDYKCRGTMSDVEAYTKNLNFYRIHAAYVVNLANIERFIQPGTLQMKNNDMLTISQRRLSDFKETYMRFTRRRFAL